MAAEKRKKNAWQPSLFGLVLAACLLFLAVMEIINLFRLPEVRPLLSPGAATGIVLYQKGRPQAREAWLFIEPQGDLGPPVCFQRIDCRPQADSRTGVLHWSVDGNALYALRRRTHDARNMTGVLWLYDIPARKLYATDAGIVGAALPWSPASESGLLSLIQRHRGHGPVAVSWYELGKSASQRHRFAWQVTRWEKALPSRYSVPISATGSQQ